MVFLEKEKDYDVACGEIETHNHGCLRVQGAFNVGIIKDVDRAITLF